MHVHAHVHNYTCTLYKDSLGCRDEARQFSSIALKLFQCSGLPCGLESNHNTLAFPKSLLCQLDDLRHLGSIARVQCT